MTAEVRTQRVDQALVVNVSGEIDHTAVEDLWPALEESMVGEALVVWAFAGVVYADSSFVRLLVRGVRAAAERGAKLRIAAIPDLVIWRIAYAGVTQFLNVYPDVAQALAAADRSYASED